MIIVIKTAEQYQQILAGKLPVLAYFSATWCGPCRRFTPVIDKVAEEYAERLSAVKIDGDAHPALVEHHQVDGFPTVLLIDDGTCMAKIVGAKPKRDLDDILVNLLSQ